MGKSGAMLEGVPHLKSRSQVRFRVRCLVRSAPDHGTPDIGDSRNRRFRSEESEERTEKRNAGLRGCGVVGPSL